MEGDTGTESAAANRWASARELAAGVRDEHYTRRRTRLWLLILFLLVAVGGAGFFLGMALPNSPQTEASWPRTWAAAVLLGCAFLWMVLVSIHAFRTKTYIPRWKSILSPLTRQERREVVKQWRGRIPVSSQDLPLIRAAAVQTRTQIDFQLRLLIFWAFLVPAQMLNSGSAILQAVFGITAALFVIAAGIFLRDRRRITRFLDRPPGN